jgi:predicted ATPase
MWHCLLAQLQGKAGAVDDALASIAEGLALAEQTGGHRADSFLHRVRGDILAVRDPAGAEAAYREALRIAREQGARTFELQAALPLAKLLNAAARPVEAHAVLAPALDGFSPPSPIGRRVGDEGYRPNDEGLRTLTPDPSPVLRRAQHEGERGDALAAEMPELAEAQALLAALAQTDEVKSAAASRRRRLQLETRYGQAMMFSRGFASEESKIAFARARTLVAGVGDSRERFDACYGLFAGSLLRGELSLACETAESLLLDAVTEGGITETAIARGCVGLARLCQGDFHGAEENLAEALMTHDPEPDRDAAFQFGWDNGAAAAFLTLVIWVLGDAERSRALGEEALARADEAAHAATRAGVNRYISLYHILRRDAETVMRTAKALVDLGREHGMALYLAVGEAHSCWARARLGDRESGMTGLREALAAYLGQGNKLQAPLFQGLLAELEAEGDDADGPLRRIDEALALANETGERWTDAPLHRIRGAILRKRDPANPAPAEEAFLAAIAIAQAQKARSFELQAALALAKLYQSTGRPVEAHAVLAPALEGFCPTPEMQEIAEAQALLAALMETDEVKSAAASRQRRLQLQTRYGQAMMYSRGYASDESKTAFACARTLAAGVGDASERFDAYYGLCAGSMLRGELSLARETAESFLRDAENAGRMTEAAVARRCVGHARLLQGDLIGARTNLAEALRIYDSERDRDARFRFGWDNGAAAAGQLTLASWALGEQARALSEEALARAEETGHAPTRANVHHFIALYHMLRGDPEAAKSIAMIAVHLGREHGMALWLALGEVHSNWACARPGGRETEVSELRRALAAYVDQGNKVWAPLFQGRLAELEAEGQDADGALRRIDEALALANETSERWTDALLHRIRGEILLKRDPANPAPAEEAFRTAIAVAQAQKARSFELQAALALARLYQSTGRPADAHTVLAQALGGFASLPSPTGRRVGDEGYQPNDEGLRTLTPDPSPVLRRAQHEGERGDALAAEMPELGEAQALLAALGETDEVKAAEAQRQRRLHLQTAYGQAVMYSKGFAAEETKAAFARAAELAAKTDDFSQRFAAAHGQWTVALVRGEFKSARDMALAFLREAENQGRLVEAGVARRGLALICYLVGNFAQARAHCERALAICEPERDREARERFSEDTGCMAMSILATTSWQLGEVERARELIDLANRRAAELGHAPSMAHPLRSKFFLEMSRGDAADALAAAEALAALGRDHGMAHWLADAELYAVWARCRLHDESAAEALVAQGVRGGWFSKAVLAELELHAHRADSALAHVDEALVVAGQVELHCDLPFAHLVRGEILLKRDPANPALAEEAFQTAVAVAKEQGARSWGLRAALSLARLYESTGRPAQAHAVLAPALEGFAPTREMPEIAEAHALLAMLAEARNAGNVAAPGGATKSA